MNAVVWIRWGIVLTGLAGGCAAVPPEARREPARAESPERPDQEEAPTGAEPVPAPPPRQESTREREEVTRRQSPDPRNEPAAETGSGEPAPPGNSEPHRVDEAANTAKPPTAANEASPATPPLTDGADLDTRDRAPSTTPSTAPPSPPAFVLSLESRDSRIEIPVEVPTLTEECDVVGKAVVEGLRLSLLRYAPAVSIHERIINAPEGEPGFLALHVTLQTPVQHHETWLVPGSRVFGRATFPAARIQCLPRQSPDQLAATRDLLRELQSPGAKILLEVKNDGRRRLFPAREGEVIRTTDPAYTVTVERIFGNFTLDPKTGKAHDVGSRPFNPAVQARIEHRGRTRTAWLFSQLPAFSREAEDEDTIFSLVYPVTDHPHQRAEITVVDGGSAPSTVFLGRGGQLHERVVASPGTARLGGVTVGIPERITNARIRQVVQADPGGRPAVLVAWRGAAREGTRWIPLGAELELRTRDAVLFAQLRPGGSGSPERSPHGGGSSTPPGHPPVNESR